MIIYRTIGEVLIGWSFALRGLRNPLVREPFFLVGGIQLIVLIALGQFHAAALAGILAPVVRFIGGEAALHYPEHFWSLPELYRNANVILASFFTYIAWGVATMRFAHRNGIWREGFRGAPTFVGIGILAAGLPWGITTLFDLIPLEISLRSAVIRLSLQGIELLLILLVQALVAFAIPFAALRERSFLAAVAGSAALFLREPLGPMIMFAIPAAVLFPPTFFLFEMDMGEKGLPPEGAGLLLAGVIVLRLIFDALIVGGLTCLFLQSRGHRK